MGFVVSLTGYRPTPRYDLVAWTGYLIQEAPAESGPWTQIDSGSLSPVDGDPTDPAVRNFTTTNATAEIALWYRIRFTDQNGNYETSQPVQNLPTDAIPTAAEVRVESKISFAEYSYAAPAPGDLDPLELPIAEAALEFTGLTGIDLGQAGLTADKRVPLIRRAIRMLVEYNCAGSQMEVLETAADFDLLSGFNAANYSETRRGVGRNSRILHPWPALDKLLGLILYYDSNGNPVADGPAIDRPGVTPVPGQWINQRAPRRGLFDQAPTVPYTVYPEF